MGNSMESPREAEFGAESDIDAELKQGVEAIKTKYDHLRVEANLKAVAEGDDTIDVEQARIDAQEKAELERFTAEIKRKKEDWQEVNKTISDISKAA